MSELAATAAPTAPVNSRFFVLKRWFSIVGLAPLGVFVVFHLLTNARSWSGPEAYDQAIEAGHGSWINWMGTVVLLSFFAFHAFVGILQMKKATPASPKPARLLHWQYILQRVSAIGVLLFVPAHVIKARILPALNGGHESFDGMHEAFAIADERYLTLTVYLLGTLGVAYHLSNGLWTAGVTLGIVQGARAQQRARSLSIVFMIFLVVLAYGTIFQLLKG